MPECSGEGCIADRWSALCEKRLDSASSPCPRGRCRALHWSELNSHEAETQLLVTEDFLQQRSYTPMSVRSNSYVHVRCAERKPALLLLQKLRARAPSITITITKKSILIVIVIVIV